MSEELLDAVRGEAPPGRHAPFLSSPTGKRAASPIEEATPWTPPRPHAFQDIPIDLSPIKSEVGLSLLPMSPPQEEGPSAMTLDDLLEMDHVRNTLVFSPLDPMPRLDFGDLRLDVGMLESALGLSHSSYLPTMATTVPLGHTEVAMGRHLASQTMQAADELVAYSQAEGWALGELVHTMRTPPAMQAPAEMEVLAVRLDGLLHRPDQQSHAPSTAPVRGAPKWHSLHASLRYA